MSPTASIAAAPPIRGRRWAALSVGPLLVLLLYSPTLLGTFLSDDYLVNTMLSHDAAPRVAWDAVLADFSREWMGLRGSGMYRPLVSLSFALTYPIGGCDPLWFHLFNVLLHAGAALLCAMVAAHCGQQRPVLAAVLGGAVLALHPAVAEATCWVSARTTGLQLLFAMLAMLGFAGYLRRGGWYRLALCYLGLVAALMSKENAVLLPGSFLVLDLLLRGWSGTPRRALHLSLFGIVGAYFLMRWTVLGVLLGGSDAGLASIQSDAILSTLLDKFELLVLPIGGSLTEPWGSVLGALGAAGIGLLVLPALCRRDTVWAPLLLLGWIGMHFAPTYQMAVHTDKLAGSRMVVGATAVLAIGLANLASRNRWPWLSRVAASCLVVGLLGLGLGRMTAFLRAYEDMRALRQDLMSAAVDASPERPLGVVAINRSLDGVTFLNCNALFPLLEKPFAASDRPLVSLGYVFQPVPDSEHLLFDVGPWRALREMGATLFEWHRDPNLERALSLVDRQTPSGPQALPTLVAQSTPGGTVFLHDQAIDTWRVEALELEVAGACSGGKVEWLYFDHQGKVQEYSAFAEPPAFERAPDHLRLSVGEPRDGNTVYYLDVSHLLTFLAVGKLGGLAGIKVQVEGEGARALRLRLLPRADPLPLPRRLHGAVTPLQETRSELLAPTLPAGATAMTLYLIGPDTTLTMPAPPGPLQLSAELQRIIAVILRSSRQKRYYFYYEATGSRTWRSTIDWMVLQPPL